MHRALAIGVVVGVVAVGAAAAMSAIVWHGSTTSATLEKGAHSLTTGFLLDPDVSDAYQVAVDHRVAAVGAHVLRIHALWGEIAPVHRPKSFNAADPADPAYHWKVLDAEIQHAHDAGLEPLLTVTGAPAWAQRGGLNRDRYAAYDPDPEQYATFATALAKRYSGSSGGLSRVRLWEAWNEPNVSFYFTPQTEGGPNGARIDVAAEKYRALLNAFADAVHAVDRSNVVAAGSLAPFTIRGVSYVETTGGITFMRELLCMSVTGPPEPTCSGKVHFDALSFHPYTSGGPDHKANIVGDLSLGNMPEARSVLAAAIRAGHVVSSRPVQMWVTEFSWDTRPPDPRAVPTALHMRWVAEAMYRMWQNGVSLLIWYQVDDWRYPGADYQSGLWYRGATLAQDRPKPSLQAFRFPFVAYASSGRIRYWGRAPAATPARVTVQIATGSGWHNVTTAHASRYGVFSGSFASSATKGHVRAVVGMEQARGFSLTVPPDFPVTPFGVGSVK